MAEEPPASDALRPRRGPPPRGRRAGCDRSGRPPRPRRPRSCAYRSRDHANRRRRQHDTARPRPRLHDRGDEQVRPEQELVPHPPTPRIVGEIVELSAQHGLPVRVRLAHDRSQVGTQRLAGAQVALEHGGRGIPEAPHLIRAAGGERREPSAACTGVDGIRSPCKRMTGQNAPNWNHRTSSSRKPSSSGSPWWKPPMSVVNHGIPATPMWMPAVTWARSAAKLEAMSPDHTRAPYRWLPAPRGAQQVDDLVLAVGPLPLGERPREVLRVQVATCGTEPAW